MSDETGQRILTDRPVINSSTIDIEALGKLDKNTFGYAYFMFLKTNGFDPDERAEVKYVADEELAYMMKRYRQCHDFYHIITELPTSVPGELALKYAELFQTGLPVCALSATVGSFKLNENDRHALTSVYLPWAVKIRKNGHKWINVYWEEKFELDMDELRRELNVEVAPKK